MSSDWKKIEASKRTERARLAALPIGEKFRILEQMRERAGAIKAHKKFADDKSKTGSSRKRTD
jgi:hypothetical protein